MKIRIDEDLELSQFELSFANSFFASVQANPAPAKDFCSKMQAKYTTLEKIELRIEDAISNKFLIDRTPDFFIIYKSQIVGVFEFHPLDDSDRLEIGFWLYPKYRGLRILTRIFPTMIDYASRHFSDRILFATTAVENESSQKLLSRNGFRKIAETKEIDSVTGEAENQFSYERRSI